MIVVRLMGGLGNQMFQYATGLRLAHKHRVPLRLDISVFDNMAEIDTPRHYALGAYKISGQVASEYELKLMLPQDFQATLPYRIKRRLGLDKRLRPLGEAEKGLNNIVLQARSNTWLLGWWQNEGYFSDIRKTIIEEFQPKKLSSAAKDYLVQIKSCEAVSVHVRRSDYITNKHASKEHGTTPIDYYVRAIDYMRNKNPELTFFVFSDDLSWCKKNLTVGKSAIFVEAKDYEEIYLMSQCQHNIIANSSFSWWGAWLNDAPDKIVIAPKVWFQNKRTNAETQIVPKAWIKL